MEAGTELQAKFSELSKAIGAAVQRSNDRTAGTVESPSLAIVDAAPLRASTSCPTSRLLDAREAISSSFTAIFSMVVKSHSDAAHITKRVVSRARP